MKKIILVLALAFLFFACDNGGMEDNPFVGTWENENGQWVFTDTTITVY